MRREQDGRSERHSAYIRQGNDQELLELALLENLQRENLNAIEIGLSYKRLMDECVLTQEQVADRMGKERSTVTNLYTPRLNCRPDIRLLSATDNLAWVTPGLIAVENVEKQLFIFNEIMQDMAFPYAKRKTWCVKPPT